MPLTRSLFREDRHENSPGTHSPRRIALVRVAAIAPVRHFLARIGAPVDRILERALLWREVFYDLENLIPFSVAAGFLAEAARSQDTPDLGCIIGAATPIVALGTFGRSIAGTPSLRDALATAARHLPAYNSGAVMWLEKRGDDLRLCHHCDVRLDDPHEQAEQFALMTTVRLLQSVAGPRWRPRTVYVSSGIADAVARAEALRGSTIAHTPIGWAIAVPSSVLALPMPRLSARVDTASVLARWETTAPATDFAGAVAQLLQTFLPSGETDIKLMASWIGTSVRTLQRRLEAARVSYADLLAKTRFAAAVRLLGDDARLRDIAAMLGYSDAAHFTRAFRRWTGNAPRTFRRMSDASATRAPSVATAGGEPVLRSALAR